MRKFPQKINNSIDEVLPGECKIHGDDDADDHYGDGVRPIEEVQCHRFNSSIVHGLEGLQRVGVGEKRREDGVLRF